MKSACVDEIVASTQLGTLDDTDTKESYFLNHEHIKGLNGNAVHG